MNNQKSLDKKKTKELDWTSKFEELLVNCEQSYLSYNEYGGTAQNLSRSENEIQDFISSLLQKQRTELLEEILNLECLKEEFVKERWLSGSEEIPKEVFRNQLRKELIDEIKKL